LKERKEAKESSRQQRLKLGKGKVREVECVKEQERMRQKKKK
jgi:hypothetical protein